MCHGTNPTRTHSDVRLQTRYVWTRTAAIFEKQLTNKEHVMSSKAKSITGWVMSGLVGLFMIVGSGSGKFFDFPGKAEMMDKLQIPTSLLPTVGVIEITVVVLFLIPRTSFLGAILTSGYLGGALWTHLRVGDTWFFPIIIGVWMWVALGLRQPAIFKLALGQSTDPKSTAN